MAEYRIKPGRVGNALIDIYYKIEDGVAVTYKRIETAFVDRFLEQVDDAPENEKTTNH